MIPWLIGAAVVGIATYALSDSSSSSSSSSSYDPEEAKRKRKKEIKKQKRKILEDDLSNLKSSFRDKWKVSFESGDKSNRILKRKNSISKLKTDISELVKIRESLKI